MSNPLAKGEGKRRVIQIMRRSPGLQLNYLDIAKDAGLTKEQTNNVLTGLTRSGDTGVFRVRAGIYVYHPQMVTAREAPDKTEPQMPDKLEYVGTRETTKEVVYRDDSGAMWVVVMEKW